MAYKEQKFDSNGAKAFVNAINKNMTPSKKKSQSKSKSNAKKK